jgi:hypothetical protein
MKFDPNQICCVDGRADGEKYFSFLNPAFFYLYINRGVSIITLVSGGTDLVIQTFPPITERVPITVSPPKIVAPE